MLPMRLFLIASQWLLLAFLTSAAHAQDASTPLRARVAAAPQDVSLQCQLAFALVSESHFEEALATADRAIAAIPRPLRAPSRRTLGACLYNRGRAHEGLGHSTPAVQDYLRSLRVRPNNAVTNRILSLVPDTLPSYLPSALAALELHEHESIVFQPESAPLSSPRGTTWRFVTGNVSLSSGHTELVVFAFAEQGEEVFFRRLDEWSHEDNGGSIRVENPRAFRTPDLEGASLVVDATGGGACGRMDGFMDFEHHAVALVALVNGVIRSRTFVTLQHDCGAPVDRRVRIRGANVVLGQAIDGVEAGEHPIATLLGD